MHKNDTNPEDSRALTQGFLKLLETVRPYPDSLDVPGFRQRDKAVREHQLSQNSGLDHRASRSTRTEPRVKQVMIPDPEGTILPHEPVIK
jgi:hypothetical protein